MAPTVQLSNITLSYTQDSIPTPFFSLGDALSLNFSTGLQHFKFDSLYPNACNQTDGSHNCTAACMDPKQAFASLDTMHNCAVWPFVYACGINGTLSPSAATLARSLGLEKDPRRSSVPSQISKNFQQCLLQSCDDQCTINANKAFPGGFVKAHTASLPAEGFYDGVAGLKTPTYFNPCPYITTAANADIAGIGVLVTLPAHPSIY